jgi:hypothetical protein
VKQTVTLMKNKTEKVMKQVHGEFNNIISADGRKYKYHCRAFI